MPIMAASGVSLSDRRGRSTAVNSSSPWRSFIRSTLCMLTLVIGAVICVTIYDPAIPLVLSLDKYLEGSDHWTDSVTNGQNQTLSVTSAVDENESQQAVAKVVPISSKLSRYDPLSMWSALLKSAPSSSRQSNIAIEVGVHTPIQCKEAAELGFITHCFEPSPKSYQRAVKGIAGASKGAKTRLTLHNEAVGSTSGGTIPFHSTGGTGDHVGEFDMWRMEKRPPGRAANPKKKMGKIIEVPTIKMDDFIRNQTAGSDDKKIFLLKVDTQGFEPSIFSGLQESLSKGKIQYLIFEFWPRGMDLLAGTTGECSGRAVLDILHEAGYALYALSMESHPRAPLYGGQTLAREASLRPMDEKSGSSEQYCRWFFDVEKRHPSKKGEEEYRFGYWSDFVAVAPGAELPPTLKK